jgi:hypothetical protein
MPTTILAQPRIKLAPTAAAFARAFGTALVSRTASFTVDAQIIKEIKFLISHP